MPKLYMLSGVPQLGSGKSTWAKKISEKDGSIYVSRDEIRLTKIKDNEEYFSKEEEVFKEFINRIQSAINDGKDVIADATHTSKGSRAKFLKALYLKNVQVIAVVINTPSFICLERNAKRSGRARVPDKVMKSMIQFCSIPRIEEGFDKIIKILYKESNNYGNFQ